MFPLGDPSGAPAAGVPVSAVRHALSPVETVGGDRGGSASAQAAADATAAAVPAGAVGGGGEAT